MMKNEDILVEKAMNFMKSNVYSGKSWLIIARSLYPRNFNIQVVVFVISFFIVHTILDVLLIPRNAKASIPPGARIMLCFLAWWSRGGHLIRVIFFDVIV